MKLTLSQLVVVLVFSGMAMANDGKAQEFLNKPVNITLGDTKLSLVLSSIEKQTGVKFVYSSKAIRVCFEIEC